MVSDESNLVRLSRVLEIMEDLSDVSILNKEEIIRFI